MKLHPGTFMYLLNVDVLLTALLVSVNLNNVPGVEVGLGMVEGGRDNEIETVLLAQRWLFRPPYYLG